MSGDLAARGAMEKGGNILALKGITKSFSGNKVLDSVDMEIKYGEVHAIIGENGAGKSTLMRIISGIYTCDSGELYYEGSPTTIKGPGDAKDKGIAYIHQEISNIEDLTVAENIFMGSLPLKKNKLVDWETMRREARGYLDQLECDFSENETLGSLSVAHQQMVEIAKALALKPKLIIFDEPTASLTEREKEILFRIIRKLKESGVASIYISHRMDEIFEITDRITILRDGKKTGDFATSETNAEEVTRLMVGRDIVKEFTKVEKTLGKEFLRVEGLGQKGFFDNISFTIREGEIVGLYGLVGAGRTEIAETIFGIRKPDSGRIFINGVEQKKYDSKKAVAMGMGFVSEERKLNGLVLTMDSLENMSIAVLHRMQKLGFVLREKESLLFDEYVPKLSIKVPKPTFPVKNLSGGNQQKIILARWLAMNCKLLILDEPTRGIDVGSKAEIHRLIKELAVSGVAILVISSEMPEIMGISDRIITIWEGVQTAEFKGDSVREQDLINGAMNMAI